jgi:hypothetical protein
MFKFEDAQRLQCKASIMIEGLPGKGKTGLALLMGYYLSGKDWSKVFHIDTENKSANLFVDIAASDGDKFGKFKVGQLTSEIGFKPSNFLAFRDAAIQAGADVVIEDSISHAWQYKGGVLDILNDVKSSGNNLYAKDSYAAWGAPEVVKEKNNLLNLIRDHRTHVITTVRVKEKMEYVQGDDGKMKLQSLGEQQIQQGDLKYEPDLVLQMQSPGSNKSGVVKHPVALCTKSRYAIFEEGQEYEFTPELLKQLKDYLEDGADPNTLLAQQKDEYVKAVTDYLKSKSAAKVVWNELKKQEGYAETKLADLPLDVIKRLYIKITM